MTFGIDFDDTIWDNVRQCPMGGALDALMLIKEKGHRIIIHSRNKPAFIRKNMEACGLPFDSIWGEKPGDIGKPPCDYFIDDSAIQYETWPATLRLLGGLLNRFENGRLV